MASFYGSVNRVLLLWPKLVKIRSYSRAPEEEEEIAGREGGGEGEEGRKEGGGRERDGGRERRRVLMIL